MTAWLFILTFGVALLSGMGVGSAGVLVVWLTVIEGVPQLTAQGLNLVFFLFSSGAALLFHIRRLSLPLLCILLLIPAGFLGSMLGVTLATVCPTRLLQKLFGGFLILTGGMGLYRPLVALWRDKTDKKHKK